MCIRDSINDCMHHTFNFLNFVCYLPSSSCLQYSTHMFFVFFPIFFTNLLPALVGEHDFESCMYVKSWKNVLLNTPGYPKNAKLGALIASKNLQIPLEKQAFLVHGLSWVCLSCTSALPCLLALLAARFSFKICWLFSKSAPRPRWRAYFSNKFQACCIKNLTFLMPICPL